jgi:hypothetical protein
LNSRHFLKVELSDPAPQQVHEILPEEVTFMGTSLFKQWTKIPTRRRLSKLAMPRTGVKFPQHFAVHWNFVDVRSQVVQNPCFGLVIQTGRQYVEGIECADERRPSPDNAGQVAYVFPVDHIGTHGVTLVKAGSNTSLIT